MFPQRGDSTEMRVMILSNFDLGLYQFRKELIQELLKDNEVFISLPYGKLIEPLKKMGCKFIDTPLDRRGINPIADLMLLNKYHRMLKREKPDLVITYTIKPNIYGGIACRIAGTPYAVNITGLGTAFQNDGILRKIVTRMYKESCKKAKVVFFENVENRQIFIDLQLVKESQACLLNGAGVNLEYYHVMDYPEDIDEIRFLFIGRVMKEKGVDELFIAMKKLVDERMHCSLDIVGPYEEDYREAIKQYENEGWLRYRGYQKDVRAFIKNCHCFVLPSWHEGMANTNLECAASGRPVITSNIHGCLEAVLDGKTGYLVEKKNADELYRAMKKFAELSYETRKLMGIAGRRHMEETFDKREVVKATLDALVRGYQDND